MINDTCLNCGKEVKFYSWNVEFLRHVYVEHIRRIQFEPQMAEEIFV